jgi:hypothetical protein
MGRAANFTAASRIFETGEVAVKACVLIPPDLDDVAQRSSRAVESGLPSATWRRRPPAVCAISLYSRLRSGKVAFALFSRWYHKSPANASNNFLICGVGCTFASPTSAICAQTTAGNATGITAVSESLAIFFITPAVDTSNPSAAFVLTLRQRLRKRCPPEPTDLIAIRSL